VIPGPRKRTRYHGLSKDPVKRANTLANLKKPPRRRQELVLAQQTPGTKEFQEKSDWKRLVAWARLNSPEAALHILAMLRDARTRSNVRFACADWIVSRGFGRAPQLIKVEDDRRALATAPAGLDEAAYVAEVKRILTQAGALDEVPAMSVSDGDVDEPDAGSTDRAAAAPRLDEPS